MTSCLLVQLSGREVKIKSGQKLNQFKSFKNRFNIGNNQIIKLKGQYHDESRLSTGHGIGVQV